MKIAIRRITDIAGFRRCVELQEQVWGMRKREIVPADLLVTAQRNGGLVLGAFTEEGEMIGLVFGFLGASIPKDDEEISARLKHTSHMVGVLPKYQDQGVGYRLKLRQRELVLSQGIQIVTWTYDPLESRNAYLNIAKLGAVCQTYLRDAYGEMTDALNVGLSSDRLQVEWWIESQRVVERIERGLSRPTPEEVLESGARSENPATLDSRGLPVPPEGDLELGSHQLVVEIPAEFQSLKEQDLDLARAWRSHTREIFERCFEAGYRVEEFLSQTQKGQRRSAYLLRRVEPPPGRQ